jgi:transcriptional regulator with XRE-family HTH domain
MPAVKTINQPPTLSGARMPTERARDMEFAKRLRQLMEARELTQSDLAAKIWDRYENTEGKFVARGRDRISVWIRGKSFPDNANLEKLAKALNVKVSELAPVTLVKAAHHGVADWSITKPHGAEEGTVFVQLALFVSTVTAHKIQGLLLEDERQNDEKGNSGHGDQRHPRRPTQNR